MRKQMITPESARELYHDRIHCSSATRVGDMIWVSGQVGRNMVTDEIGQTMEEQARLAFENLKEVLEEAGATLGDIVEIMTFHTDMGDETEDFMKVKDEFIPDRYPAWTGLGVAQLARPEYKIEIRAIAVAGSGSS